MLDFFFITYTTLNNHGEILIIFSLLLLFHKKTRKLGYYCLLCLLSEFLINDLILKGVIARPRPFIANNIQLKIKPPSGYSMPSGHTNSFFTITSFLHFENFKYKKTLWICAILMGISRIYLQVHYVSDVLVGAFLGIIIGFINHLFKSLRDKRSSHN